MAKISKNSAWTKKKSSGLAQKKKKLLRLKPKLDQLYREFQTKDYLDTDPIGIVHQYLRKEDQELVAYVASVFSFGSAKLIRKKIEELFQPLGANPKTELLSWSNDKIKRTYKSEYYRFFKAKDIQGLFIHLRSALQKKKALEDYFPAHDDPFEALAEFQNQMAQQTDRPYSNGFRYMFPNPRAGAAKRLHMFMRWMIRKDEVDLGLWRCLRPNQIYVPLDTHVFDIAKRLGLIERASPNLRSVVECTENLKLLDAKDPLKYDFALCRLGILGLKSKHFADFE